jgi:hypothetical protein
MKERVLASRSKTESLVHSLQQRAFNGGLFSNSAVNTETVMSSMVQPNLFD